MQPFETKNVTETKAMSAEVSTAYDDFYRTFSAFKETNDDRLAQIEQRLCADVVTEEKLDRLDDALNEAKRRLDRLTLDQSRPHLARGGKGTEDFDAGEYKSAFVHYMRSGEIGGLKKLEEKSFEAKSLSAGSGPDGGYLVPSPAETEILRRLALISPIRSIASVQAISGASLRKAYSTSGPACGWVAETDARPQSNTQQIANLSFPAMELYAMPAATQTLLDDGVVDIEQWIADEVQTAFAEQEGTAFVTGNGSNKPMGFMSYPKVAESSWSWGNTGYLVTGVSGAFPASGSSDVLIDLVYALKAGYRQNAKFVMNRKTQSLIRKFKTSTGEYLWAPPVAIGAPATLMNFPLIEAEAMADVAADSYSIAFGDFQRGYMIVDRLGIRILRDPYSAKPYVLFYTTKRVGGGIQDFDAIKLLKFGTA
jgi:HK97 family phage major capsid protein